MTEISDILTETAAHILAEPQFDEAGLARAIAALAEAGLTIPFTGGDGEISWADIFPMIQAIGGLAPFTAVADLVGADFIASRYGLGLSGPALLADGRLTLETDGTVSGEIVVSTVADRTLAVIADAVTPEGGSRVVCVELSLEDGLVRNSVTGETRRSYALQRVRPSAVAAAGGEQNGDGCLLVGALLRSALISGAVDKVARMTLAHCSTRKQFGRPLAAFQAVQHQLSVLATESAATAAAVALAARRHGGASGELCIGVAKLRTAKAARLAVDLAHQCHGAIGFTQEYPLHLYTRRLLAWRGEFGADRFWAQRVGRLVAASESGFWRLAVETAGERGVA